MDSLSLAGVGILVKNGDDRAMLCFDNSTSRNNWNVSDLVVIDTPDVNCSI